MRRAALPPLLWPSPFGRRLLRWLRWLMVALAILGPAPAAEWVSAVEVGLRDACADGGCCDEGCADDGCCEVPGTCGCCAMPAGMIGSLPQLVLLAAVDPPHLHTAARAPPTLGAAPRLPPPRIG